MRLPRATVTQVLLAASAAALIERTAGLPPQLAVVLPAAAGALLPDLPLLTASAATAGNSPPGPLVRVAALVLLVAGGAAAGYVLLSPLAGFIIGIALAGVALHSERLSGRSRGASQLVTGLVLLATALPAFIWLSPLSVWVIGLLAAAALSGSTLERHAARSALHHPAGLLVAPALALALWWQFDAWWMAWMTLGYLVHLGSEVWIGLAGTMWRGGLYAAFRLRARRRLTVALMATAAGVIAWSALLVRLDDDRRLRVQARYPLAALVGYTQPARLTPGKFERPPWNTAAATGGLLAAATIAGIAVSRRERVPLPPPRRRAPQAAWTQSPSPPPPSSGPTQARPEPPRATRPEPQSVVPSGQRPLEDLTTDLVAEARAGRLPQVIGRTDIFNRMVDVLGQAEASAPVLLGDAGVGKTAVVHKLAHLLAQGSTAVPERLRGARLLEVHIMALDAGTVLRGMFEERLQRLLDDLQRVPNTIVFVDEVHSLVGAGSAEMGATVGAGQHLKPALARGTLKLIGATTPGEYRKYIEKDPALARRFTPVHVPEPSRDEAVAILRGAAEQLAAHHRVTITPEAIERAIEWSIRYLPGSRLPGKAKKLLDRACSAMGRSGRKTVEPMGLADVIAADTGIPVGDITAEESERLRSPRFEARLAARVKGQDAAVQRVAQAVRRARSGMADANKPIGAFLFFGPTGVGKTELAKALGEALFGTEQALIRVDMTEYRAPADAARLTGAAPGYTGHEEGGQLTEAVRRRPYSVVLIDEMDKAHPDTLHPFMRVFDEGKLTDSDGTTVDFTNTLLIATSNFGWEAWAGVSPDAPEALAAAEQRAAGMVRDALRPEFYNRLTPVAFRPLNAQTLRQIVDARVKKTVARIRDRHPHLQVDIAPVVYDWLARKGYDPEYGARPLQRLIEEELEGRIADPLVGHTGPATGWLRVGLSATGELVVEFRPQPR